MQAKRTLLVLRNKAARQFLLPACSRSYSSKQTVQASATQVSPHIGFYKTFARPVAKVLLMATFTYQLSYWLWVKLEKDEIKHERQAEIRTLEMRLQGIATSPKNS